MPERIQLRFKFRDVNRSCFLLIRRKVIAKPLPKLPLYFESSKRYRYLESF